MVDNITIPPNRTVSPAGVLVAVCSSLFIVGLNTTSMNTAIGVIAEDFDLSTSAVAWTISAYTLAAAALVAPSGQFGDVFGRRRVFAIGLALFAVGAAVAAVAPNGGVLIAGRAFQGAGAALLLPAQLSIIRTVYPPEQQGRAVGIWAAVASATFAVGPLYGGLFADTVGWRFMFAFDLVLIAAAAGLAVKYFPPIVETLHRVRPDYLGAGLLAIAIILVVLVLQQGGIWGWTSAAVVASLIVAILLLGAFWFVEHRVSLPIVHFALFRNRSYLGGTLTTFCQGFALMGFLYFIATYTEAAAVYDYSPLAAGVVMLPGGLVMLAGALVAGAWADRIGYRIPNTAAMVLIALGSVVLALVPSTASGAALALVACVSTLGIGIAFSTTSASGMAAIPTDVAGEAAGVINVARYLGTVVVVALGTTLSTATANRRLNSVLDDAGPLAEARVDLDDALRSSSSELAERIAALPISARGPVDAAVTSATTAGFHAAQLLIAACGLLAAIASWILFAPGRPAPQPSDG